VVHIQLHILLLLAEAEAVQILAVAVQQAAI
jgi:hypothetical protein